MTELKPKIGDVVLVRGRVIGGWGGYGKSGPTVVQEGGGPHWSVEMSEIAEILPRPLQVGDRVACDGVTPHGTVIAIDDESKRAWVRVNELGMCTWRTEYLRRV